MQTAALTRMINDTFTITEEEVASFRRKGYLKLKGLFTEELIEHMRVISTDQVKPPSDNYGSGFSKLKYDIGNDDPTILSLMRDQQFAGELTGLAGRPLFYTQGLGFELERNTSTGFPWHVGTQSFGFQRREDIGYTIWTPLCTIDPSRQRGGMAYVPRDVLSGEFVYQHINLLPGHLRRRIDAGQSLSFADFSQLKNSLLNSPEMTSLLDDYAEEDRFEPGDAFLFDKFVLHRSVPLGEGPTPSRLAYALRFSSVDALYDKQRVDALAFPRHEFNYDVGSSFNDTVASRDGERVYDSPYFDDSRIERTLERDRVPSA